MRIAGKSRQKKTLGSTFSRALHTQAAARAAALHVIGSSQRITQDDLGFWGRNDGVEMRAFGLSTQYIILLPKAFEPNNVTEKKRGIEATRRASAGQLELFSSSSMTK
jgi:hypothetical protein